MNKITIDGKDFVINKFQPLKGIGVKAKLIMILAPVLGQFAGEGLKAGNNTDKEKIKSMSINELFSNLDPDVLAKAALRLSEVATPEQITDLYETLLSQVMINDNYLLKQLNQLIMNNEIDYLTLDKLVLEVIKVNGFFGSLMKKFQETMTQELK